MADSDIFLLLAWGMMATGSWLLGYYYGIQSLKNRNKKFIKAIEDNNHIYKEWTATSNGQSWEAGYAQGIKTTLDTLNSFLERAS